jgi:hypothetical protein
MTTKESNSLCCSSNLRLAIIAESIRFESI